MLSYTHFTHDERICLHNLVREGLSIRQIACRLGRSPSTISRELKRNSSSKGYHHWRAQILTICRRRQQHRPAAGFTPVRLHAGKAAMPLAARSDCQPLPTGKSWSEAEHLDHLSRNPPRHYS